MELKKFITRLLYFSIAIAGVFTAAVILFSPGGDVVSNGIATTFLILLADGIIIVGLFARHNWLKIITWAMAIYSLVVAVVYTWLPTPSYQYGRMTPETTHASALRDNFDHLTFGGYIIAFALVGVSLFSLFDKVVDKKIEVMDYAYKATLALGVTSGLALAISASISNTGLIMRFGFSVLFLALTSAVIMAISLISSNIQKSRIEMQARIDNQPQQPQFPQGPNPHYNQPRYPATQYNGGYNQGQPSYQTGSQTYNSIPQPTYNTPHENVTPQPQPQQPQAERDGNQQSPEQQI